MQISDKDLEMHENEREEDYKLMAMERKRAS